MPVDRVDLEMLDGFLMSDRAPSESMMLSDLDGFLTGIAVGPEFILPSEWLPLIWGGEAPEFADEAEAKAILGTIMGRYNEILRQVGNGTFEPILWATADDTVIAGDWAEGFALAIGLRPEAWDPLFDAEEDALALLPILALCGDENGDSALGLDAETDDDIMEMAPAVLPAAVMEIAAFWRERRAAPGGNPLADRATHAARTSTGPGRNEPCPCGSGKKFKRCCGA